MRNSIPRIEVNILDFGAVPNDDNDDSIAINKAIQSISTTGGTVQFPKGRWVIEQRINIHSNFIRLEGNGSTLYCPNSLADVYGENKNWSWSSGFIVLSPQGETNILGTIQHHADDGATHVEVQWLDETPTVGQWVQIWWYNDTGSDTLLKWLYGDAVSPSKYGSEMKTLTTPRIKSWFKVVSIEGASLELDPPLPLPADPAWKPTLMESKHLLNCIIENFDFEFVESPYPGHLKERGHNGIALNGVVNSLIKNISTSFADSGIFLGNCGFVTVQEFETQGRYMHHPICLSSCSHCLVEEFTLNAPHIHGTTISWCSHFNVFTNGEGNALAMDSHRACSFRNLHQDIVITHGEKPLQPLRSGGSYNRGLHSARENVYWNIEHKFQTPGEPFNIQLLEEWPLGVFVGWHGNRAINMEPALEGQVIRHTNRKLELRLY